MNSCPDEGVWRAWLDHEIYDLRLDQHLDTCVDCTDALARLRENAAVTSGAMGSLSSTRLPSPEDTHLARERLAWRQRRREPVTAVMEQQPEPTPLWSRVPTAWRIASTGIAAALVLSLVVGFTDQGRATAAAFLAQFRSQQIAAVEISPQSQADIMRSLSALSNFGTFKTAAGATNRPGGPPMRLGEPQPVSLAEASRQVGFQLQTPDVNALPAGFDRTPQVQVIPANEFRYTFDKSKASAYYRSQNRPEVNLPDKFDGATLVVSTPAAAILQYSARDGHQALVVGQSGELVVSVEGTVTLEELRDFLLSLPGLPKETTDQLKTIKNWNETLPIPIPTDKVNWKADTFKGSQGLLLNDNTGVGSAAIWSSGGHLYGVAGTLKANDLKRVADSLH